MIDNFGSYLKKAYSFDYEIKAWSRTYGKGDLLWTMNMSNIVVNQGLQLSIDNTLLGVAPSATWYFIILGGTPVVAATDTMASHAGWAEITDYDEAARQVWTGVRTGQNVTNSASAAVINITSISTIGGAGLTDNATKGGATGNLFSAVASVQGDQIIDAGASLVMTYSITAADDGV